jgi:hypothetical protein
MSTHLFQIGENMLRKLLKNTIAKTISYLIYKVDYKEYFNFFENKGFHITPVNFDQPIPQLATLPNDLWNKESKLVEININENNQIDLLSQFSRFRVEYDNFPRSKTKIPYEYYGNNKEFESCDGEILYSIIRHFKPKRILEIGSGYSTMLSAQAILKNREENASYECELTAIEPLPSETLTKGFPGLSKLIHGIVQDVPLTEFRKLSENDILFIDSSHVLKTGNDVQYEFLEILPRLGRGVFVHIHDVFLPREYPKEWILEEHRFWTEQYLLQAFLSFNDAFEVLWAGSYMHLKHPDELEAAFSWYNRNKKWPASFWIRKTR